MKCRGMATVTDELTRKLTSIFSDALGVAPEAVHPDLGPEDVNGWDSIGYARLITTIEARFEVQLETDEIMEMTSFATIEAVLRKRLRE